MKGLSFNSGNANFLLLVPLAAGISSGDATMTEDEMRNAFVGNTVVTELSEGTAYNLVQPNGVQLGLHPELGKINGTWRITNQGQVCSTWNYSTGTIVNCGKVTDFGNGSYKWGRQSVTLREGDIKQLGNQ